MIQFLILREQKPISRSLDLQYWGTFLRPPRCEQLLRYPHSANSVRVSPSRITRLEYVFINCPKCIETGLKKDNCLVHSLLGNPNTEDQRGHESAYAVNKNHQKTKQNPLAASPICIVYPNDKTLTQVKKRYHKLCQNVLEQLLLDRYTHIHIIFLINITMKLCL